MSEKRFLITFVFYCPKCGKTQLHAYTLISGRNIVFPEISVCEHCGHKPIQIIDVIKTTERKPPPIYV